MREIGKIISAEGNRAKVAIEKKAGCEKCGMCIFPKGSDTIVFDSVNNTDATVGDTVVMEMKNKGKLLAIILAFLVPILLIAGCVLIGTLVIKNEIIALVSSLISVALWYTILAIIDKKLRKLGKNCPIIVEKIQKER